jgi:hypothetical protein
VAGDNKLIALLPNSFFFLFLLLDILYNFYFLIVLKLWFSIYFMLGLYLCTSTYNIETISCKYVLYFLMNAFHWFLRIFM